jgi:hypothetical protein
MVAAQTTGYKCIAIPSAEWNFMHLLRSDNFSFVVLITGLRIDSTPWGGRIPTQFLNSEVYVINGGVMGNHAFNVVRHTAHRNFHHARLQFYVIYNDSIRNDLCGYFGLLGTNLNTTPFNSTVPIEVHERVNSGNISGHRITVGAPVPLSYICPV